MPTWVWYLILLVYIVIAFRAVMMWIDKMARVIIANYIAWITCFAFGNLINQWVQWLAASPDSTFMKISYTNLSNFLSAAELILILLVFAWLIWLIYACGKIQVSFGNNATTEKLYFIVLIPITVLSFICGPYIALMANGIETLSDLQNWLGSTFWFLWTLINHLPFRMFLNWLIFIIISSRVNFKISLSAKATKIPEWI